jgi:hypothetical protein
MNNYNLYKNELNNRYQNKIKQNTSRQKYTPSFDDHSFPDNNTSREDDRNILKKKSSLENNNIPIKKTIHNYKQDIVILDSNDRDKNLYPSINEFYLNLAENLKNVLVIRLLKTEYTLEEYYTSMIINNSKIPIQFFKTFTSFIYLNGYNKIKIANDENPSIFSQISAGIEILPSISTNFYYDPYAIIMNPIEKKLKKFHIKICDSKGKLIDISPDSTSRLILTLAIFRL